MPLPSLAIVGTGIAGLGSAHYLKDHFDLTLFERESHVGGHSNTICASEGGEEVPIDTGFMVFNKVTYPLLTALFEEFDVPIKRTDMSFSVRHDPSGIEWHGTGLNKIFGQRKNLLSPRFWRFIKEIDRFNKTALAALDLPDFEFVTLRDFVDGERFSDDFYQLYLVPMSSAVWSTPPSKMDSFPAATLIRFWENHGFLGRDTHHPWWTVDGGSREYVRRLSAPFAERIHHSDPVVGIHRIGGKVQVSTTSDSGIFDRCILACHADEALALLSDPSDKEQRVLSPFRFQHNTATLHTDPQFMPHTRRCWASWNYHVKPDADPESPTSVHYWMNSLQGVSKQQDYFVSLNARDEIPPEAIIRDLDYTHPLFDPPAIAAQDEILSLNDPATSPTHFVGAYQRYGFHEDGLWSAHRLAGQLVPETQI